MAVAHEPSDTVLSRQEVLALLDEQARKYLGMTGEEFIERARAGTLPEHPIVAHLALLAGEGTC